MHNKSGFSDFTNVMMSLTFFVLVKVLNVATINWVVLVLSFSGSENANFGSKNGVLIRQARTVVMVINFFLVSAA